MAESSELVHFDLDDFSELASESFPNKHLLRLVFDAVCVLAFAGGFPGVLPSGVCDLFPAPETSA